jgi:hypothetical protein
MLLEVPNRGQARIRSLVDGGGQNLAADAGDSWLLRTTFARRLRAATVLYQPDDLELSQGANIV